MELAASNRTSSSFFTFTTPTSVRVASADGLRHSAHPDGRSRPGCRWAFPDHHLRKRSRRCMDQQRARRTVLASKRRASVCRCRPRVPRLRAGDRASPDNYDNEKPTERPLSAFEVFLRRSANTHQRHRSECDRALLRRSSGALLSDRCCESQLRGSGVAAAGRNPPLRSQPESHPGRNYPTKVQRASLEVFDGNYSNLATRFLLLQQRDIGRWLLYLLCQ